MARNIAIVVLVCHVAHAFSPIQRIHSRKSRTSLHESSLIEPTDSNFGRKEFWNEFYRDNTDATDDGSFSWYSSWEDLEPFVKECLDIENCEDPGTLRILLPGVGNDPLLRDLYDAGFGIGQQGNLAAFDYAEDGVERAKEILGPKRLDDVCLEVADCRNLNGIFEGPFELILEKGTLDAIYLSGGSDKVLAMEYLTRAVCELKRLISPNGGVLFSVSAACVHAVQEALKSQLENDAEWTQLRDGSFHMTEDGYASNNVDGTMIVWQRNTERLSSHEGI